MAVQDTGIGDGLVRAAPVPSARPRTVGAPPAGAEGLADRSPSSRRRSAS